ncbi:hypothetical protein [Streptosporangium sp. NPDC006930]|uniref:hypothetical protein n=1 Tax=unclassified Streptosporangium TaxID=2632669 RepID=UPI00342EF324
MATALVWSTLSRRRSASAGTDGAAHLFLVAHQVSQEETAARLRFQVADAHPPHRMVRASPISVSETSARSRSRPPTAAMVRSMAEA